MSRTSSLVERDLAALEVTETATVSRETTTAATATTTSTAVTKATTSTAATTAATVTETTTTTTTAAEAAATTATAAVVVVTGRGVVDADRTTINLSTAHGLESSLGLVDGTKLDVTKALGGTSVTVSWETDAVDGTELAEVAGKAVGSGVE